jgi:hypothetical protein
MAKPKSATSTDLVETQQDSNFADDAETEAGLTAPDALPADAADELVASQQDSIEAIRQRRQAARAVTGNPRAKRRVTNYQDAERLRNLHAKGHTHLVSNEELVDFEENGLLPDPSHFYSSDGSI